MSPTHKFRTTLVLSAAAALALTGALVSTAPGSVASPEPLLIRGAGSPGAIPDSYLVVLRTPGPITAAVGAVASAYDADVRRTFGSALHGFSAAMTEDQATALAKDPRVAFVQQNQRYTVSQENPPWGLDRSDQRDLPLDKKFEAAGKADNVNVYVIDTGIYPEHKDFGGRASVGTDTVGDGKQGKDCHGHGSHVAGTIAGDTFGLAKGAKVFGVRVLDCGGSGTTESVVAGIDWVTAHAKRPAIANMSLGGPADEAMDKALQASVDKGISYAVAAGNESSDACRVSPARAPAAITVGATDNTDKAATFSNVGKCVDVFAPGVDVESVAITGPEASAKHSGTSMASPHVAGGVALYLAAHPDATPAQVTEALVGKATRDKIQNPGQGSPNKLLYVGIND